MKNITWLPNKKKVHDPVKKKRVNLAFLRTNAQDEHDDNMSGVDFADQFRGH